MSKLEAWYLWMSLHCVSSKHLYDEYLSNYLVCQKCGLYITGNELDKVTRLLND